MVGFGLVLFVFLFLVTFELMFKYISRDYLEKQSIEAPMGLFAFFAPISILIVNVLLISFFMILGFVGAKILYNTVIENIGGVIGGLYIILMIFFELTAFFYLLLYFKSFFAIFSSYSKKKKERNKNN